MTTKPRVLLVGVRDVQFDSIKKLHHEQLSLYTAGEKRHQRFPSSTAQYDYVVSMIKFTAHRTHEHFKKHKGYRVHKSGISSLNALLSSFAS